MYCCTYQAVVIPEGDIEDVFDPLCLGRPLLLPDGQGHGGGGGQQRAVSLRGLPCAPAGIHRKLAKACK